MEFSISVRLGYVFRLSEHLQIPGNMKTGNQIALYRVDVVNFVPNTRHFGFDSRLHIKGVHLVPMLLGYPRRRRVVSLLFVLDLVRLDASRIFPITAPRVGSLCSQPFLRRPVLLVNVDRQAAATLRVPDIQNASPKLFLGTAVAAAKPIRFFGLDTHELDDRPTTVPLASEVAYALLSKEAAGW